MYMATITVILTLLFLMAVLVGTILLQIFLSRRKSRWPGLILPGLTFLYSLLSIFSMAACWAARPARASTITPRSNFF